jgi:hypothetical protein
MNSRPLSLRRTLSVWEAAGMWAARMAPSMAIKRHRNRRHRDDDRKAISPHRHAEIIPSMPGLGVILGAEFLAATGADLSLVDSADRPAPTRTANVPRAIILW